MYSSINKVIISLTVKTTVLLSVKRVTVNNDWDIGVKMGHRCKLEICWAKWDIWSPCLYLAYKYSFVV